MSLYLIDTDTLQLYQDEHPAVVARIAAVAPGEKAISVVTVEEQLSGWYAQLRQAKSQERLVWAYRRLAANIRFVRHIQILDYDDAAVERYEELKRARLKMRKMDLQIAAAALRHGG